MPDTFHAGPNLGKLSDVTVIHGDCIDAMAELAADSIDAIVTDPPYGLGFMGKAWDDLPPGIDWAKQCLRVLKPGGHLLAFGGTRTWHRLAVAVEDAGFEIRDSIAWLYGSGFPKSLDVSKAIDKARKEDVEPVRVVCEAIRYAMDRRGLKSRDLVNHFGGCHPRLIDHWAARKTDSQPSLPTWEQWETLTGLFGEISLLNNEVWRLNGRKGLPGDAWQIAKVVGNGYRVNRHESHVNYGSGTAHGHYDLKAPATPEAEQWQGWGTALKPAFEPIVVARKPLAAGTVAANVLTHGTGALNIDACRIEADWENDANARGWQGTATSASHIGFDGISGVKNPHSGGRWPANVVLDADQAAALDEQSGYQKDGVAVNRNRVPGEHSKNTIYAARGNNIAPDATYGGGGGASRFFYCAKAPKKERPVVVDADSKTHSHPTVKPLTLMRWLARLITPPGGKILDPFAGSGTMVEAALLEGFQIIAIERGGPEGTPESYYLPMIQLRIARTVDA